jgi:outer membrane immunogenic protein
LSLLTIGPEFVGINGGYAWGQRDPLNIITNRFDNNPLSFSGGVFGGTLGAQSWSDSA